MALTTIDEVIDYYYSVSGAYRSMERALKVAQDVKKVIRIESAISLGLYVLRHNGKYLVDINIESDVVDHPELNCKTYKCTYFKMSDTTKKYNGFLCVHNETKSIAISTSRKRSCNALGTVLGHKFTKIVEAAK